MSLKVESDEVENSLTTSGQTIDETPVNLFSHRLIAGQVVMIKAEVVAIGETSFDTAAYGFVALFKYDGITTTQVGSESRIFEVEDDISWNAQIVIDGDQIHLQIIGDASENVNWIAKITTIFII